MAPVAAPRAPVRWAVLLAVLLVPGLLRYVTAQPCCSSS